jgi:hypothetical protein
MLHGWGQNLSGQSMPWKCFGSPALSNCTIGDCLDIRKVGLHVLVLEREGPG